MTDDPINDLRSDLMRAAVRRHRPWWRRRPAVLGLLAGLVVAAPATAALGGLWKPDVEPLVMKTVTATAASEASVAPQCAGDPYRPRGPRSTDETPPERMLDLFGVLRTPQTAADRAGLSDPGIRVGMAPRMIAPRFIRRLGTDAAGRTRWLIPSLVVTPARKATDACPARPASRRWLLTTIGGGGAGGAPYEDLATRPHLGSAGIPGNDAVAAVDSLVPDGVATVTITYPGDNGPPRTWPVDRNFLAYRVELPVEQAYIAKITWNAPDGTIIPHR